MARRRPQPRLTGERTLPGIWHENYWFRRHEAAYARLADLISQSHTATVLDAGCGEGYGCELLRLGGAEGVVGFDYDQATLVSLRQTYDHITPVTGNLVMLPFRDSAFDAVVSLQVIEHIWDQPRFLAECARVVKPEGWIAISTPNRLTFSPGLARGEKPLNPFHVNEFDPDEFRVLVGEAAAVETVHGLRHGSRIHAWEKEHGCLTAAQLAQPYAHWSTDLADFVSSISVDDFQLSGEVLDEALDLLVIARHE